MGRRAHVNGIELAYEIAGEGPTLVWCHGLASCMDGDRDVISSFAEHFTVLAYDARGHGGSSPVREASSFSYTELGNDLIALLEEVGWKSAIFAGASMGAATLARVACLHPELADAVVMVRAASMGDDGTAPAWLQLLFAGGAHAIREAGIEGAIQFLMSIPDAREEFERDPGRVDHLRSEWTRHDPLSIAAALEGIPPTPPLAGGLDLSMISCRALVVPGNDLIHPTEAGRAVASLIPGAVCAEPLVGNGRVDEVASLVKLVRGFLGAEEVAP